MAQSRFKDCLTGVFTSNYTQAEGKLEGEQAVVLRQLARRIGGVFADLQSQIQTLSSYQLEALAEALLDCSQPADLVSWLQSNQY